MCVSILLQHLLKTFFLIPHCPNIIDRKSIGHSPKFVESFSKSWLQFTTVPAIIKKTSQELVGLKIAFLLLSFSDQVTLPLINCQPLDSRILLSKKKGVRPLSHSSLEGIMVSCLFFKEFLNLFAPFFWAYPV